jgi:hypothetical protein
VIAAEHERQRAGLVRSQCHVVQLATHTCDFVDVFLGRIDGLLRLGNRRRQITSIGDRISQRGDLIAQPAMRNADGPMSTPRRAPPSRVARR